MTIKNIKNDVLCRSFFFSNHSGIHSPKDERFVRPCWYFDVRWVTFFTVVETLWGIFQSTSNISMAGNGNTRYPDKITFLIKYGDRMIQDTKSNETNRFLPMFRIEKNRYITNKTMGIVESLIVNVKQEMTIREHKMKSSLLRSVFSLWSFRKIYSRNQISSVAGMSAVGDDIPL